MYNKKTTEASRPAKRPARPKMIDDVVAQENRRLHEENAMLKATMEEFKSLLAESLHEDAEERGKMRFGSKSDGSGGCYGSPRRPSPMRQSLSRLCDSAVIRKELQLERKRSVMYMKECESLRAELDKLKDGDAVDKIAHKNKLLEMHVAELMSENVALTKIQRNQEKKLLSEEDLEKEWAIRMAALKQDLSVAADRTQRSQQLVNELRKKGLGLTAQVKELRREKGLLEETVRQAEMGEYPPSPAEAGEGGGAVAQETREELKKKIYDLMNEIDLGKEVQVKLGQSARSFKAVADRKESFARKQVAKKDLEIEELKRQLKSAQVDARQNLLNMKELKSTLTRLVIGNMKVKELSDFLPSSRVDIMDLKSIAPILPSEIDVERTKFLSPNPPPSEIKAKLRFKGRPGTLE